MGSKSSSKSAQNQITETLNLQDIDGTAVANLGDGDIHYDAVDFGAVKQSFELAHDSLSEAFDFAGDANERSLDFGEEALKEVGVHSTETIKALVESQDTAFNFGEKLFMESIGSVTESLETSYDQLGQNVQRIAQSSQSEAAQTVGGIVEAGKTVGIALAVAFAISQIG